MKRFLLIAGLVVVASTQAHAADLQEGKYWRDCTQDAECVLIDGTCEKTAVHMAFSAEATAYYKKLAQRAKCVEKFWVPKEVVAECKPLAPSKATQTAQAEPHSSCKAVAKPKESEQ